METISKFFTDTPTMISFLMFAGTIAIPSKAYGVFDRAGKSAGAAWGLALVVLLACLILQYFTYQFIRYPAWMGWLGL